MHSYCDYRKLPIHLRLLRLILTGVFLLSYLPLQAQGIIQVQGELKTWHRISVMVTCPEAECGMVSQTDEPNPFTDYRLLVTFVSPDGEEVLQVPGFYAGDGNSEISEADSGNVWIAHFTPHKTGTWQFNVSFQKGDDIVLDKETGTPVSPDGGNGTFTISSSDKLGKDFRARGFLKHVNKNYFYFSGTNTPFLKNGTGSPENILYYHEFHNTYQQDSTPPIPAHQFSPHVDDFNTGDPLWGPAKSKGQGIIGALNYLSSLDVNSYYFIINNTALRSSGQGTGVWPWISPDEASRDRFSVAKLAQWEVVFSHMDSLGISMNLVTQDRINQWDLDDGELGRTRKLLYRELVARYAHHPGLIWHLGEENSATPEQIKDYANFIRFWDVYEHPIVSQANGTLDAHDRYYTPLLGYANFEGASLQVGLTDLDSNETPSPPGKIHNAVLKWVQESNKSDQPWVVMLDEIGHWSDGIVPDGDMRDPTNRRARREGFWGTIMAGGAGSDWYYGSDPFEYNDIWAEDFTKRSDFFQRTRNGINMILDNEIPYWEMVNKNELSSIENTWVFGKDETSYLVYSPYLEPFQLNLPSGGYSILWYDAFEGGPLQEGTIIEVEVSTDSSWVSIGDPIGFSQDAVALVTLKPIDTTTEQEPLANRYSSVLEQNYPNPFLSTSTIAFEITATHRVKLNIYDTLGRVVREVENAVLPKGAYRYELDFSDLPSGLYFYRLRVGDSEQLQKSMLRL